MASGSPDVTDATEPSDAGEECSGNVQVPFSALSSMRTKRMSSFFPHVEIIHEEFGHSTLQDASSH